VIDNLVQFKAIPTADEFATFTFREALLTILTDARDLEHARRIAGEALIVIDECARSGGAK
jgi:hypothetical protein